MKISAFSLIVSLSVSLLSASAFAKSAKIYYGTKPAYGLKMEVTSDGDRHRVSGKIYDLQNIANSDSDDYSLACYTGSEADLCSLVQVAVAEENEKSGRGGKKELQLTNCGFNKQGNFDFIAKTKSGQETISIGFPGIPSCSSVRH